MLVLARLSTRLPNPVPSGEVPRTLGEHHHTPFLSHDLATPCVTHLTPPSSHALATPCATTLTPPSATPCQVLWLSSRSAERWVERRNKYTRSLAAMSMVGYILGLGDRHLSNIMLDQLSGAVVRAMPSPNPVLAPSSLL